MMGQACRVPGQEKHGGHRRWGQADPPRGAASAFGAKHQHPRGLPRWGGTERQSWGVQASRERARAGTFTALSASRPSLPAQRLIKLVSDGTFPVARGANRAWIPACQERAGACWGSWCTCAPPVPALPSLQSR